MNYLNQIYNITNIDVTSIFGRFLKFTKYYSNDILRYYTIYSAVYPKEAFDVAKTLKKDIEEILQKLYNYKNYLMNLGYWDIIIKLDNLRQKLEEIPAYPRLYQVGFLKKQIDKDIYDVYVTKQNESLNDVAVKFNTSTLDLMILNNFSEDNFSNKGGVKVTLKSSYSNTSEIKSIEPLTSVIDIQLGDNVLGKDLPPYFELDEESEDLIVCTPAQTFKQTVIRLFSLKKGSIPEFPNLGVAKDLVSDAVKGEGLFFPILLRQLNETLNSDDTIIAFTIEDIQKEGDSYKISATVQNRLFNNLKFSSDLE